MEPGITTGKEHDVSLETIRSWWKVPAVAHFCSLFRSTFNLPDFEIEELEEALYQDSGTDTSQFLVDLLIALLKGSFQTDDIDDNNYSDYLRDICNEHWEKENRVNPLNNEDTRFQSLSTLMKVEILYTLCDYRLDAEDVSILKDYDGETLRVEPLGQDSKGAFYWYFYGTRLYREEVPPPRPPKIKKKKKKKKRPDPPPKQRKQKTKTNAANKKGKGKQKQGTKGKGNQKKRNRNQTSNSSSDSDEDDDDVPLAKMASPPRKRQKGAPVTKKGGKIGAVKGSSSSKPGSKKKSVSKVAKKTVLKTKRTVAGSKQSNAVKGNKGAKKGNVETKTAVKRGRGQSGRAKAGPKNNQSESDEGLSLADLKRCKVAVKTEGKGNKTKAGRNVRGDESSDDDSESPLVKKSKKWADSSSSWRSAEETSTSSDSSSSEDEPDPPKWQVICQTEEDWQKLTDSFKKTRVKCERELYQVLSENFLPEIHSLFVAKERELRRKLQDLAPKRTSSRIAVKKSKQEEEEKIKALMEYEEEQRRKAEEASRREFLLQERRRKVQAEERRKMEGEKKDREYSRQQRAIEREMRLNWRQNPTKRKKKQLYDGFKKVLETVKNHPDAWPFIDPVQESFAPAYYDIIQRPMDISTVEVKVQEAMYRSKAKFEADMELIFSNCMEYNGPESEYTMMGANVASCFQEALDQHFPPGLISDGELSDIASDQDSAYCLSYPRELRRRRKALNYTEMESTSDSGDTGRDEDDEEDLKGEVKVFPSYMAEKRRNSEKNGKSNSVPQKVSSDGNCPAGNRKGDEVKDNLVEEEKQGKTSEGGQVSICLPEVKEMTEKSGSPEGVNEMKVKGNDRRQDNTKKKSPKKSPLKLKVPKTGRAGDKVEVTADEKIQNNSEHHNYSIFSQNIVNSSELTSLQRLEAITDRLGKSLGQSGSENKPVDAMVHSTSCDKSPDKGQKSHDKTVAEEQKLSTSVTSSKEEHKPTVNSIVQQSSENKEGNVLSHWTTATLKIKSESDSLQSCSGATTRSPKIANTGTGSPLVVPSNLATVYNPGATTKSFTNQSGSSPMVSSLHSSLTSVSSSPVPNSYLSLLGTHQDLKSSSQAGEGDTSRPLGAFRSGGSKHFSAFHSVGKDHGLSRTGVQNAAGISHHSLQSPLVPTPPTQTGVGNQHNPKGGQYGTVGPIMSTFASQQSQSAKPTDPNSAFQPAKVYPNQPTIIRPVSRYPAQAQTIRQNQFLLQPGAIANQGSTPGPQLNILQIASAPSLTLNIQPNGLLNNSSMLNVPQNRASVPAMYQQSMGQISNHVVQSNMPQKPTLVVQYQGTGGESPAYGGTQFRASYQ